MFIIFIQNIYFYILHRIKKKIYFLTFFASVVSSRTHNFWRASSAPQPRTSPFESRASHCWLPFVNCTHLTRFLWYPSSSRPGLLHICCIYLFICWMLRKLYLPSPLESRSFWLRLLLVASRTNHFKNLSSTSSVDGWMNGSENLLYFPIGVSNFTATIKKRYSK